MGDILERRCGMSKARTKTFCIYTLRTFLGEAECWITCYPQQKWEYEIKGEKVELNRKGISLIIPKNEFEKHWKVVE